MSAQNFSLQREGRCTVYYTNAKQVVILQSGSSECYYGPDRQAPLTAWQRAPWTAMKSTRQNKASFPASCRTHSPFIPSVPLFFTLTSPGNNTAMAARLRVETSYRVPAPLQMLARLNPRASSGEKRSKSKHTQDHPEWEDGDHHNGWVLAWPHSYSPFYQYYKACGGGEALILSACFLELNHH